MRREKGAIWKFSAYGFLKNQKFFEPFLLLFFLSRNLSFLQIGFLISIRELFTNLLEIPTGAFADVYGKKKSMVWAFVFYIISFLVFYFSNSFIIFALAMFSFALGETLRSGTHKAIIFEYLDRQNISNQKLRIYGITRSYSKIGSALSALVASSLVFYRGDYGIVFLASTIPHFMGLLLMLTYPEDVVRPKKERFFPLIITHLRETFLSFKKLKNLTIGMVNLSLDSSFFKVSKDYLQPILNSWAIALPIFIGYMSEKRTALVIGVVYFFIFITASTASRHASKIKDKFETSTQAMNIIFLITIFSFLLVGIFNFFQLTYPIIALFLGLYFLTNVRKPVMISYIADITESSKMATVLSMENQLRSIIALIIAPILGFLADSYGISTVFLFSGIILLIGYSTLKLHSSS